MLKVSNTIFILVGIGVPLPSLGLKIEGFADTQSLSYSEIAPIQQFSNGLEGPPIGSGSTAFTINKIAVGQKFYLTNNHDWFGYALFSRLDYSLQFSNATAQLYYANENNITFAQDKLQPIYLKANHLKGNGISLMYSGSLQPNFRYQVNLAYIYATNMIYGTLNGELNSLDSTAQGDLNLDYFYSEDVIFERDPIDLSAHGFSFDLSLDWDILDNFKISLVARDIYSEINWKKQQQTIANATSNRINYNANGDASVRAALTWQELNSNVSQHLPQQFTLNETYQFTATDEFILEHFYYDRHAYHRLGYKRHFGPSTYVGAYYDLSVDAYRFELHIPHLKFGISFDDTNFNQAKLFGLSLILHAPISL